MAGQLQQARSLCRKAGFMAPHRGKKISEAAAQFKADLHRQGSEGKKPIAMDGLRMQQGISYKVLAERTGLEPATPGVTGRYSNQLNYHSAVSLYILWLLDLGSNQGPTD